METQSFQPGDIVRTIKGDRFHPWRRKEDLEILQQGKPWRKYRTWICMNLIRGTKSTYLEKNLRHVE